MGSIIAATNNQGKIKEIKEILKQYHIISLQEAGIHVEVEETEDSFEGNSLKKAREIYKLTKQTCLADDSGLCIDYLGGRPGVNTKRFLGETATQQQRNQALLELLKEVPKKQRKAKVVTCISFITKTGEEHQVIGEIHGYIAYKPIGENGFGFDPIFELENGKTLAQLSAKEKNQISHRRVALEKLKIFLDKKKEF